MKRSGFRVLAMVMVVGLLSATLAACGQSSASSSVTTTAPAVAAATAAATTVAPTDNKKIKIGISMATLQEERWQRDRDVMTKVCKDLGAEVVVQSANGDENLQNSQCENLITQGINALIIVPQNGASAAAVIATAHAAGVKVIAYDRLISNCDLDFYTTFDCTVVGQIQGEYALSKAPKGNYIMIGGSPTDNNAHLIRNGQMMALKAAIDKGDIKVVVDQWAKGWDPQEALKYVEDGLTANKNNIAAIVTSNDGCAGAAIQALTEQKMAGKIPVTGLDADIAATQRIVEGTQSMTVYRRFSKMDEITAKAAVALAKGEKVEGNVTTVNNGKIDVPSILLTDRADMFAVEASNMDTLIKDNWLKKEDIYKNVPKEKWPN